MIKRCLSKVLAILLVVALQVSMVPIVAQAAEIPALQSAVVTADGNLELNFNVDMRNPIGNEGRFVVRCSDGAPRNVTEITVNDEYWDVILLKLQYKIMGGESFTVSYTPGNVASTDGVLLPAFSSFAVTNPLPHPVLSDVTPNPGTVGQPYSHLFHAIGGTEPYTYYSYLPASPPPPGLSIATNGSMTGTPTLYGVYNFSVMVADYNQAQDVKPFTMVIAPDTIPPAFLPGYPTAGAMQQAGSRQIMVTIKTAEAAHYAAVVVPDGAATPSQAQVKEGKDAAGNPALKSYSSNAVKYTGISLALASLPHHSTAYDTWIVIWDDSGNTNGPVRVDVVTPAPAQFFKSGYPKVGVPQERGSKRIQTQVSIQNTELDALVYCALLPDGAPAPSLEQIAAGKDGAGNNALAASSTICAKGSTSNIDVVAPTDATVYDLYLVAGDTQYFTPLDRCTSVYKLDVTSPLASDVCVIGATGFLTLPEALSTVQNNQTIKLLSDITIPNGLIITNEKSFTIDLNGKILTANNNDGAGLYIANSTMHLIGIGALHAYGTDGVMAEGDGASVEVTSAFGSGLYGKGVTTSGGGSITVWQDAIGNGYGAHANGGTIHILGNAIAIGPEGTGVMAQNNGNITVGGNASGTLFGVMVYGEDASIRNSTVNVAGFAAGGQFGVFADHGNATVHGVMVTGAESDTLQCAAVLAKNGSSVVVAGDATALAATGVTAFEGSRVQVDGTIDALTYIDVGGTIQLPDGYTLPTEKDGYYSYTGMELDSSVVLVRDQTPPIVTAMTLSPTSLGAQGGTVQATVTGQNLLNRVLEVALNAGVDPIGTVVSNDGTTAVIEFSVPANTTQLPMNHTVVLRIGKKATATSAQLLQAVQNYTVTFKDGSATHATRIAVTGSTIGDAWPANPTKAGYAFGGWFTGYNGAGARYTAQTTITRSITLFAKWTPVSYTLSYALDGGTVNPANPTTYTIESGTFMLRNPVKAGYTFTGWSGTGITGKAMAVTIPAGSVGDRSYTAYWVANQYTITAATNNPAYGTVYGAGIYTGGGIATLKARAAKGYRFVRWDEGAASVSRSADYSFPVDRARSLMAMFAKIGTPTAKAAPVGYNSVKISWTKVTGATVYQVYRATSKTGIYSWVANTTATAYTNKGLTTGKTYYYKVRAKCTAQGYSTYGSFSAVQSVKPMPATPTVTAVRGSSTSIKLSWSKVYGVTKYQIYRATSKTGTYTKIAETTSTAYTNSSLTRGRTYYYKVRAYRTVNGTKIYGKYSAVASAKP